jgi:hypothetical protein
MADLRIPPGVPQTQIRSAAQSQAVEAAQKAFFRTALLDAGAAAPTAPAAFVSQAKGAPAAAAARIHPSPTAETPGRLLRPGSIIDIKV